MWVWRCNLLILLSFSQSMTTWLLIWVWIILLIACVTVPKTRVSNVTTVIHGNDISFPLENSNACERSGLLCPLIGNQTYKYVQTLPIKIYYPPVRRNYIYISMNEIWIFSHLFLFSDKCKHKIAIDRYHFEENHYLCVDSGIDFILVKCNSCI